MHRQATESTSDAVATIDSASRSLPRRRGRFLSGALAVLLLVIGSYAATPPLSADAATCVSGTYRQGSKGNCVKYIQQIVTASGAAKLTADGDFGPLTRSGVVAFQKSRKLVADGVVGPKTWKSLCAVKQSAAANAKKKAGCGTKAGSTASLYSCTVSMPTVTKGKTYTVRVNYKNTSGYTFVDSNTNPVYGLYNSSGKYIWENTPDNSTYSIANGGSKVIAFTQGTASLTKGKRYKAEFVIYAATKGNSTKLLKGTPCSASFTVK